MSSAQAKAPSAKMDANIFADRRFAAAVLAFVVLVFTPIGARMSLKRAVGTVEEQFFTGVGGRGAAAGFLADAEDAALGLISVGAKYDAAADETGELRVDRSFLLDAMDGRDVSEYAGANALMVKSFRALKEKLLSLGLSTQDAADVEYYSSQFEGAQGAISHAGYNEAVAEFIADTYERFPANIIGSALGVDPPEAFQEG